MPIKIYDTGLDNVRFLWPYYLGGASVFNPDVLKDVEVMSGEFQSKYGNAMSGIINLTTRNGSTKKFKTNVGFSGFHNSFLFEGPFKKHKSSYLVAFRKTNKLSNTQIVTHYIEKCYNTTMEITNFSACFQCLL